MNCSYECLATAGLTVGEAHGIAALEDVVDERLSGVPVDEVVAGRLVEGEVEAELLIVQILGQVDLELGQVHEAYVLVGHGDDVDVLLGGLLLVDGSLAHAHADAKVGHRLAHRQTRVVERGAELADHGRELPGGHRLIDLVDLLTLLLLVGAPLLAILLDLLDLLDHIGLAARLGVRLQLLQLRLLRLLQLLLLLLLRLLEELLLLANVGQV